MALLTTQVVTRTGITPSFSTCAASGDTFTASPSTFLHIKNTSTQCVVTLTPPSGGGPLSQTVSPYTITIPATSGDKEFGPFPPYPFAAADGTCALTYQGVTGLTIAVKQYVE